MRSNKQLGELLERVASGTTAPEAALDELVAAFRAQPFEDLGFARVDHHRAFRQGFPEVVLGLGKTPEQVAAIASRIVEHGSSLLVTRASSDAFAAVRAVVPSAVYHADARIGSDKSETFKVMERRLLRAIINPSMIVVFLLGALLAFNAGREMLGGWFHVKVVLVLILAGLHGLMARWRKEFERDERGVFVCEPKRQDG